MNKLLKISLAITLWFFLIKTSLAKEINVIMPNPPGSLSDSVAKIIGDEYYRLTGDKFVITYAPGGNAGTVAAAKFKSAEKNFILQGSSSLHVYNPVLEKNLPYEDSDFKHILFVGYAPAMYISGANSGIKNIEDMLSNLSKLDKPFVGGNAAAYNLSVELLKKTGKLSKNVEVVPHKGGPEVIVNVLNGTVPVGIVGTTSNLFQLAKEGKIHVIGTTHHDDIQQHGIIVPSVSKYLKIPQTTGGQFFSAKPNADISFYNEFSEVMKKVMSSPAVKEKLLTINFYPEYVHGEEQTKKIIEDFRKSVSLLTK